MKLELTKLKSLNLTDHGTLKENLEDGDSLTFGQKNLSDTTPRVPAKNWATNEEYLRPKNVSVFIREKDGNVKVLSCSEPLSKVVRNRIEKGWTWKKMLAVLRNMHLIENDTAVFLSLDAMGQGYTSEQLEEEVVKMSERDYELVAF